MRVFIMKRPEPIIYAENPTLIVDWASDEATPRTGRVTLAAASFPTLDTDLDATIRTLVATDATTVLGVTVTALDTYVPGPTMGAVVANNNVITRAAATATGAQVIAHALGVAPRLLLFLASDDGASSVCSSGWAAGATLSVFAGNNTLGGRSGFTTCIDILTSLGNGHTANVSAVDATNFTLNWTKIGGGRAITVQWLVLS